MSMETTKAGLFTDGTPLPLRGVRVDVTLRGACVEVVLTQRFENDGAAPIEAVYVFPMEEGAAVHGFAARIGGRVVHGRVKEREEAFAAYDDAMMAGHAAFLLEQERPDVFTASVGNLRPGETADLQIRYVAIARREGDALRVSIPTTVSPRYTPRSTAPEVGQPDAERVSPERWPSVPYGLTLAIDVELGAPLASVESPSHPIRTTLANDGARIELAQTDVALDRDVVVLITPKEPGRPMVSVAREDDGARVAMLTFLPEVEPAVGGREVVFLLDCSGSMQGSSIEQAKRALRLSIRALRAEDRFDVVRFGSGFSALFGAPRAFDERSLEEASAHVAGIAADLGGTEILAPLCAILERPRASSIDVLLLTDGQVSNEAEVIALAAAHAASARVFTFGIGAGASEHLVRGVARVSRGAAEMIAPGERIEPKVLRTFTRLRTPALEDARVEWGGLDVVQAPSRVPPVFAGDPLTLLARITSGSASEVTLVTGERRVTVPIDLERASAGSPLPVLWARERIRELEDGTAARGSSQRRPERDARRKEALIALGVRYGLVSRETSYVAVDERADADATAPATLVPIPVALTHGWSGGRIPTGPSATRAGGYVGSRFAAAVPPAPRAAAPAPRAARRLSAPRAMESASSRVDAMSVMPMSPLAAGADPEDRVFDLLMTQRADGSFARSEILDGWLGARAAALDAAIAAHGDAVATTAVVLALLAAEAADRESEWRPAADKARAWLAGRGDAVGADTVVRG